MTKLEELKAARNDAWAAWSAACDAADDGWDAYVAACDAYHAELEKTREENTNE